MQNIKLALVIFTSIVALSACSPSKDDHKSSAKEVVLVEGPINSRAECTCDNSFPYYAKNLDENRQQSFVTRLMERDISTKAETFSDLPSRIIDAKEKELFLGCSVGPTDVSPKKCGFKRQYFIKTYTALRVTNEAMTALFGPSFSPTIASCEAACSNPNNPYCFNLGKKASAFIIPLSSLIDGAWSKTDQVIMKKDILSKYNFSESDDKCERGNTTVVNGVATNVSNIKENCKISIRNGFEPFSSVTGVDFYLSPTVIAKKVTGTRDSNSVIKDVEIPDFNNGAMVLFVGVGSDNLNTDFSGQVRYISDYPTKMLVMTSKGCLVLPK